MKVVLARPPRPLPLLLRTQLLFGGLWNQLHWVYLGFAMILVWLVGREVDFSEIRFWFGEVRTTRGEVIASEYTGAKENEHPVYRIRFRYRTPDGTERESTCYSTKSPSYSVTVEFLQSDPRVARIKGTRVSKWPLWLVWIFIFPGHALVGLFFGMREGVRSMFLLSRGLPAWARKVSTLPTNLEINNRRVMQVTFEFTAVDGRVYTAVVRTHEIERLKDDEELVLYYPRAPSFNVMMDSLPGQPVIDDSGHFHPRNPWTGLRVLVLPALVVIGHGLVRLLVL